VPQSQRLTLGDVRAVFRLLGEIRERGSDPVIWRRYMLTQLHQLMGTRLGYVIQSRPPLVEGMQTITCFVEEGMSEQGMRIAYEFMYQGGALKDVATPKLIELLMRGRHFTRTRRQLVPSDEVWEKSHSFQNYYYPQGIDDMITSQFFLPGPYGQQAINLHRDMSDRRPISERERRLLHLFHFELWRLWENAPVPPASPWDGLPPRLQQTLVLLRGGDSEKRIAMKLGLSNHTIHDNVKRLHAFYGVSNRAGLMAATTSPRSSLNPRLTE
jgi:DNA-binding NarL/FixJ family response regulator